MRIDEPQVDFFFFCCSMLVCFCFPDIVNTMTPAVTGGGGRGGGGRVCAIVLPEIGKVHGFLSYFFLS